MLFKTSINNFDHLLKSPNNVFYIIPIIETRIIKQTSFSININPKTHSFEFTPNEPSAGELSCA